jgi:hypothetical protein
LTENGATKKKTCGYGCGRPFDPDTRGKRTPFGHSECYNAARRNNVTREMLEPHEGFAENVASQPLAHKHPQGWEPHVEQCGNTATAISQPIENENPDEAQLIRGWNLDPSQWRIVGHVNCRRWEAIHPVFVKGKVSGYEKKWLYYYKANLERIDPVRERDLESVIAEIREHAPAPATREGGEDSFVVAIADVQMGKSDGDGVGGTVHRALESIELVVARVNELRAVGRKLGTLYVLGMGDLIESCDGHYDQQAFRVQLNRRDQVKVMRRIVVKSLERWAPMFERVVVACVGGNHGENRKDGKSFTDFADNDDVAIFEQAQEILAANPAAYGHVSFRIPHDELSMTLDISGVIVGITHGHLFGRGGGGQVTKKALDWWMKQAHGQQPIGEAKILISAHYHHLLVTEDGAKTHMQCPALEGGSDWWRNLSGKRSRPGVLTMRVGRGVSEAGYADHEVL